MQLLTTTVAAVKGIYNVCNLIYRADATGTKNSAASIQAALNDARDAGGGLVIIPPGRFLLEATLVVSDNTVIMGAGRNVTTLFLNDGVNSHGITLTNVDYTTLCNFTLDHNGFNQTGGEGIRYAGCNYAHGYNLEICTAQDYALEFGVTTVGNVSCRFNDIWVNRPLSDGIDFHNASTPGHWDITLHNITIFDFCRDQLQSGRAGIDARCDGAIHMTNVSVRGPFTSQSVGIRFRENGVNGDGGQKSTLVGFEVENTGSAQGTGVYVGNKHTHVSCGYVSGVITGYALGGSLPDGEGHHSSISNASAEACTNGASILGIRNRLVNVDFDTCGTGVDVRSTAQYARVRGCRTYGSTTASITVASGAADTEIEGHQSVSDAALLSDAGTSTVVIDSPTLGSLDLGTKSSGTLTLNILARSQQKYVNGGAHTLAPGSVKGRTVLYITNNASAGAITTSGWTKVIGSFDTTNTHKFQCTCTVSDAGSVLTIEQMF